MFVLFKCIYCGKKIKSNLNYEGSVLEFQNYIEKKTKELSVKCECRREGKVKFVAESIAYFEGVELTEKLIDEVRKLSDEELEEKFKFADYLWDK
ncbi:hypothetical protein DP145_01605 [Clostridium tetani]|uniref:hypothetical protein n=1 Tax=Clostridium tetani TaxID=1513 RepID=UPI00100B1750|nr:hypothetical protein [Clostridium tetani]RXI46062.1 hypothetical protein DP126_07685 [Clostridium tetani]RXM61454.1 hypothetical protein DP138_04520 [Clostridium tetani]RXM70279.1 hypothetical protein DP145_01605 [Clostridium tetani]BDR72190.1 hypothetical protein K144316041_08980 [Clostridium tetani]BDR73363.1 hypothetical protein K144316041_20710 [Clostridium tetani]